jgi:ketosteroid isomerase-like protein
MTDQTHVLDDDVLAADRDFFEALTAGDSDTLSQLMSDDFIMVDVMRGGTVRKDEFLGAIRAGVLCFESVVVAEDETIVRQYPGVAIVVGRTRMRGSFADQPFEAASRYTHVFVQRDGEWSFVSAQGTPIADAEA